MGLFGRKKTTGEEKKTVKISEKVEKTQAEPASMKDLYSDAGKLKTSEGKTAAVSKVKRIFSQTYRIIVKPIITEKVTNLGVENKYAFAVARKANKIEIAKAIEETYGIKPLAVNIINMKGKQVRYGRMAGKRKDWKKAIVTLPEGKTIKVYEGV